MTRSRVEVSAAECRALFERVCAWGRWGEDDERGALNELTPERVLAAGRLVCTGETATLALPLNTHPGVGKPEPAVHRMTMLGDTDIGSGTLRFVKDYIGVDYHNDGHSHIDALCHVAFDGAFYNGRAIDAVTAAGAAAKTIEGARHGLVDRGVLLDVPRVRRYRWLEPGEHVFREDLESAEREQGVTVGRGDILLIRTGHSRRLAHERWDTSSAKAGLHPTVAEFLAERAIAGRPRCGRRRGRPSSFQQNAWHRPRARGRADADARLTRAAASALRQRLRAAARIRPQALSLPDRAADRAGDQCRIAIATARDHSECRHRDETLETHMS